MVASTGKDGRQRIACGCLVLGFLVTASLMAVLLMGGLQRGARFFLPSLQQDITIDFIKFTEKQRRVNKLVLLERQSREKLVKTVNNTYCVPGVEDLKFSDSATMSIACPVVYSYYVDLKDPWRLIRENDELTVSAPALRLSRPSIDIGRVKREIQGGWLVFGEERMLRELERELIVRLYRHAGKPENLSKVRESCRASLEEFIRAWIANGNNGIKKISIKFAGEKATVDPHDLPEPIPVKLENTALPSQS